MKRFISSVFATLIFLVPSNLFLVLSTQNAYVRGILVDYLIPKVYLTDIVLCVFFLASYLYADDRHTTKHPRDYTKWLLWIACGVLFAVQIFTPNLYATLFGIGQLVKIILLYFCLQKVTFVYKSALVRWAFVVTVFFQSFVGIFQYILQRSVYGYYFLGEPELTYSLGLSREVINGTERLLPYGTTAHPNILGGILALYIVLLFSQLRHFSIGKWWQRAVYFSSLFLGTATLWMTHSISAWLAFLIGIGVIAFGYFKQNKATASLWKERLKIPVAAAVICWIAASLVTPIVLAKYANAQLFLPTSSIDRRVILQEAAINMLTAHPIIGVGLNEFTLQLEEVAPSREVIRFIQPAHSVLLLWLAETGVIGLSLILLFTFRSWKHSYKISIAILALIPIAILDHYLLTLNSGLLLLVVYSSYLQHSET